MVDDLFQSDNQVPVSGGNLPGIVPFEIAGCPIPKVDGLPEWIVAGEESPVRGVEFIREDKFVVVTIKTGSSFDIVRRFRIYQLRKVWSGKKARQQIATTSAKGHLQNWRLPSIVYPSVPSD